MASPQAEQGHCRLANELLDAIITMPPPSVAAWQVWSWVWRNSWGRRGADRTPVTSARILALELGMSKTKAAKALALVLAANMVTRNEDGTLSIQKDYERWVAGLGQNPQHLPAKRQLDLIVDKSVETVDKSAKCPEIGDSSVPKVGTVVSPKSGQKCPQSRDESVPKVGTDYKEKERKKEKERGATRALPQLPNGKFDSPRHRAELGNPEYPPEDHPEFKRLSFKLQDELDEAWKANGEKWQKANGCRKGCGRARANDGWAFCRECTTCATCKAPAADGRTFKAKGLVITCGECANTEPVKKD